MSILKYLNFWKSKKENNQDQDDFEIGDKVVPFNFDGLIDKQLAFLKSKSYFIIDDIVTKEDGLDYADVGYKIPLKLSRFKKTDHKFDKNVLFLQFNVKIDTHNEPDPKNIFRGCHSYSELMSDLIEERSPNTNVDFLNYSDVYRLKDGYYIKNTNLKDYDFVFFGFMSKHSNISILLINYLDKHKVPHLNYETYSMYDTKSFGMDLTESLGYDYIPTISTTRLNKRVLNDIKEFGFPLIVKDPTIDRGTGVWKIDNMADLVEKFSTNNHLIMIQKMIPNDGDTRVIVIKNKVELVVKRQVIDQKEFRSNVALGGKAVKTTLPQNILDMCVDLSKHVPTCDIIGFDILKDLSDGKYYVMEINISPHMATFCVVTGIDLPGIISDYIVENLKKSEA